jgi:ParB-like chromosome segregation protein Spo0J
MDYRQQTVAIDLIDRNDRTFRISTDTGIDPLKNSIAAVGLLHPPLLLKVSAGYIVVSGYRRVAACKRLGWKQVPGRVLDGRTDGLMLARLAIADNAGQRCLDRIEAARAVALLAGYVKDPSTLVAEAGALGLSDSKEMTTKLLALSRLPDFLQAAVGDMTLSFPMALELGQTPLETASALTELFSRLKPSLNRQREFVELLTDISRRENTAIAALLREAQAAAILDDPKLDRNRKSRLLKDCLTRRRFPAISRAEADFARALKKLALAPGTTLAAPRHFEGGTYTLSLSFRNRRELERQAEGLNRILRDSVIDDLLRGPEIDSVESAETFGNRRTLV